MKQTKRRRTRRPMPIAGRPCSAVEAARQIPPPPPPPPRPVHLAGLWRPGRRGRLRSPRRRARQRQAVNAAHARARAAHERFTPPASPHGVRLRTPAHAAPCADAMTCADTSACADATACADAMACADAVALADAVAEVSRLSTVCCACGPQHRWHARPRVLRGRVPAQKRPPPCGANRAVAGKCLVCGSFFARLPRHARTTDSRLHPSSGGCGVV